MDFGVGVASGAVFEVVKTIIVLVHEVKANKNAARNLAMRCQDYQQELVQIFRDCELNGLTEGQVYETVKNYTINFKAKIDGIRDDMILWSRLDFWDRITKKSTMAHAIRTYYEELRDMWAVFQTALNMQALATGATTGRLIRSNTLMIEQVSTATTKWDTDFKVAREKDQDLFREAMESTAKTLDKVETLDTTVSETLSHFNNVLSNQEQLLAQLRLQQNHTPTEQEDQVVRDARERLIKALANYDGDRPLLSVDASELTVPVEVHRGDHATIYMGIRNGSKVAIKKVNVETEMVETVYRRITRESKIWEQLDHPNIVKFIGCAGPANEFPYMISEWMENGNARAFARTRAEMEPPVYVDVIKIVLDVADGLVYLHSRSPPIIHGGLKASNILIDATGTARVTDFALAALAADIQTGSRPPPMRWSGPEILEGKHSILPSDVYSFASVILEIITNADPYSTHTHLYRLHRLVREGLRPDFPVSDLAWRRGLTSRESPLWTLMQDCWTARPESRPAMPEVRERLGKIWDERGRRA